ncbi:M18 family aminopeptidase [Dermabacteraceae bacterium P13077]
MHANTEARDFAADLGAFVSASPSSYHAAQEAARRCVAAGFTLLTETDEWPTGPGAFCTVRDGSLSAWVVPQGASTATEFAIFGAHSDSPSFKLKPKPTIGSEGFVQVGVEVYGGPLLNSWLDRELGLAGRLALRDGSVKLTRTDAVMRIVQLAVHLDRAVNSEGLKLDPQKHLQPVIGLGSPSEFDVVGLLADAAGVSADDVAGYDVLAYDTQAPAFFGAAKEFLASGRLDNLACTHAGLAAIIAAKENQRADGPIAVYVTNDHEEIGSASRSGAAGSFLEDVLARIHEGVGGTAASLRRVFAASTVVSADVGHSVHPNYAERHDPANHPLLGRGPLLKINANHRYSTDAVGAARWAAACAAADVPYQEFVSNNQVPCGSTIGPITETRLGITTVDVGMPILSMHSAREMCAITDPLLLKRAAQAFLLGS